MGRSFYFRSFIDDQCSSRINSKEKSARCQGNHVLVGSLIGKIYNDFISASKDKLEVLMKNHFWTDIKLDENMKFYIGISLDYFC